jgi:tetratricopeptide (TPR) repeat protein
MEVRGDSVEVTIKGKFPPKTFNKKAVVKIQPVLRYGGDKEKPLKPLYLKGEKVKNQDGKVVNYKKGSTFTYTDKVEYDPQMKNQNLTIDYNIKIGNKYQDLEQCEGGTRDSVSIGTITTALTVKPFDDVLMYKAGVMPVVAKKVIIYYVINETKIRDSVYKGPAVTKLRDFLKDTSMKYNSIQLMSYASPDGEFTLNKNLTIGRANSGADLVKKELKRAGKKIVYDSSLVKKPDMGEDWAGLKQAVSQREFSGKQEVMDILNSNINDDEKENRLRKSQAWNPTLVNDILPKLRRTEIVFAGANNQRTLPELMSAYQTNQNGLTKQELLMVADNTTDTMEMMNVYKNYMTNYPSDVAGKNNYAALLLKKGMYKEADDLFSQLHQLYPKNDTINNNYGVARRFARDYDKSRNLYNTAANDGLDESNNLGILYIKYGKYDSSIASFKPERCDYNTALAYTLNGDYESALSEIECSINKVDNNMMRGDLYYLRAITAARKGDRDMMATSLTRAIEMNPAYRNMAKDDKEFMKYWDTDTFKNAIR